MSKMAAVRAIPLPPTPPRSDLFLLLLAPSPQGLTDQSLGHALSCLLAEDGIVASRARNLGSTLSPLILGDVTVHQKSEKLAGKGANLDRFSRCKWLALSYSLCSPGIRPDTPEMNSKSHIFYI